jgi:ribosome-associated protein
VDDHRSDHRDGIRPGPPQGDTDGTRTPPAPHRRAEDPLPVRGAPGPAARVVPVHDDIRLGQLLKLAGVAESGAHARALLTDGEVQVNGRTETRRGRRLVAGDRVVVDLPHGAEHLEVG